MRNSEKRELRFAIAGVGNCASALTQAVARASSQSDEQKTISGLKTEQIGGLSIADLQCVAAFDVDSRKVGKSLSEACAAEPNCIWSPAFDVPNISTEVLRGPTLDGVAPHMRSTNENERSFQPDDTCSPVDVAKVLSDQRVDVLICFLPVGSQEAVEHYAQAAIDAGVAFLNCVPVFIASNPNWRKKFEEANLPLVGDDIKSQLGATVLHRTLIRLFQERGCDVLQTYQLNVGGNSDFRNMLVEERLASKRISKTNSVQAVRDQPLPAEKVHIGPSDYVHWQNDKKVAFIRIEAEGLFGAPIELEARLSVEDSWNSAGIVLDATRALGIAKWRGSKGVIDPVATYCMKSPHKQKIDSIAVEEFENYVNSLS